MCPCMETGPDRCEVTTRRPVEVGPDSVLPRTHLIPGAPRGWSASSICFTGTLLRKLSRPADGLPTRACTCTHVPRRTPTHCSCREKRGPNRVSEMQSCTPDPWTLMKEPRSRHFTRQSREPAVTLKRHSSLWSPVFLEMHHQCNLEVLFVCFSDQKDGMT